MKIHSKRIRLRSNSVKTLRTAVIDLAEYISSIFVPSSEFSTQVNITLQYPWWFIVFCLLAAGLYSFLLYRKDTRFSELNIWLLRSMAALRFLCVFLICFLLLSPLLKTVTREVERPVIILAQDNSESLRAGKDSAFYTKEYPRLLASLIEDLSDKYEVRSYTFSDRVADLKTDSLFFRDKQTDMSEMFSEIETRFSNRNVGALILAGDGLYNKGSNPLYAAQKLKMPVYTIALGDTTITKDLILSRVDHNRLAYLGNDFPVEVLVNARGLQGKSTTLTVSKGAQVLFTKQLTLGSEAFSATVPLLLQATSPGLQHYRVALSTVSGEITTANNVRDIYIDVLDSRQKVLILAAAPHPDVAAIRLSIEANQNYDVESYTLEQFSKSAAQYNLVILHQLPGASNNAAKVLSEISAAKIPVWSLTGSSVFVRPDLTLAGTSSRINDSEAIPDQGFALFTLSDELRQAFRDFPPVATPFGTGQIQGTANVMLYQRIGVVDTKQPLMYFNNSGDSKIAVFTGEGIWKWRLQDYAANGNSQLFDEFVSKTVQYLSVKENKSFFRVMGKNNFLENEPIELQAELYNQSYELINEPEVTLTITSTDNKSYPFTFSKTTNAFRMNAGNLPVGEYRYEARTKVGEKLYSQKGEFSVSPLQVELVNTIADHQLLYTLAKQHNGEMVYPAGMQSLVDKLNSREDIKTVSYSEKKLNDLINLKWIFFVLLTLLAAEWFMRKRNGGY